VRVAVEHMQRGMKVELSTGNGQIGVDRSREASVKMNKAIQRSNY